MIYVLRTVSKTSKFIKIGYAGKDLHERVRSLQTGCPFRLELVGCIDGSISDEKLMHSEISEFRSYGEWFFLNEQVEAYLKTKGIILEKNKRIAIPKGPVAKKAFVNNKFKHRDYPNNPKPIQLKDFCNKYKMEEKDIEAMESDSTTFFIAITSPHEVLEKLGYITSDDQNDKKETKYIIPKLVYNLHTHYKNIDELIRVARSKNNQPPASS